MWLPLAALSGMVGLSFNTMFVLQEAVLLDESHTAAVLYTSQESYERLEKAAATAGSDARSTAIEDAINLGFSSPAIWQSKASKQLAKERFEEKGLAGFAVFKNDSRFGGTLAYLSPEGRNGAMRAVGFYLAFLNLALLCAAFGLTSRHLSNGDPSLTWLWQFPVSRRVLFTSKLIEYVFDNPTVPITSLFYTTAIVLCGTPFFQGLGIGILLGFSAGVASAAIRLALETFLTQRVGRRTRGATGGVLGSRGQLRDAREHDGQQCAIPRRRFDQCVERATRLVLLQRVLGRYWLRSNDGPAGSLVVGLRRRPPQSLRCWQCCWPFG